MEGTTVKNVDNRETPGNKTIRLTKEKLIADFYKAGDSNQVNIELDRYPHNKPRPEISMERAKDIRSQIGEVALL